MVPDLRDVEEDWMQVEFYGEDREVLPGDESMGPYDKTYDSIRIEQPGAEFTVSCLSSPMITLDYQKRCFIAGSEEICNGWGVVFQCFYSKRRFKP